MKNFGLIHLDVECTKDFIPEGYTFLGTLAHGIAWPLNGISDIVEKIYFLNNNKNYAVDINLGDRISKKHIYQLKNIKLTKILSDTECEYCAISDDFVNIECFQHLNQQAKNKDLVFTYGRCGSHLLRDYILEHSQKDNIRIYHNDGTFKEVLENISDCKTLFTVYRKDFIEFITSVVIAEHYGLIITEKHNFQEIQEKIKTFEPFTLYHKNIEKALECFINFCDILTYAHLIGHNVVYIMYEDLNKIHKGKSVFKNTYDKKTVIDNFNDLPEMCYNDIDIYNKTMFKTLYRLNYLPQKID